MFINFIEWMNQLNINTEPQKSFIICGILTIITVLSVILIGTVVNHLEHLQIRLLTKLCTYKLACLLTNRLTFIGTILHEYSHATVATFTGAKVTKIKCFEFRSDGTLGHVDFIMRGNKIKQMIQLSLTSCAPVIMGLIIEKILFTLVFLPNITTGRKVLLWYIIISVADHMSMSDMDIKNYCKGLWVVVPIIFTIFLAIRYFVIR